MNRIADTSGPVRAYQALSLLVVALFFLQPVLAGQFQYNDKPDYIDIHEITANAIFALLILQSVLALLARRAFGIGLFALNLLIILLAGAQIGFGYAARDNPDRLAIHLPLGVALFGLGLAAALFGWFDLRGQSTNPDEPGEEAAEHVA